MHKQKQKLKNNIFLSIIFTGLLAGVAINNFVPNASYADAVPQIKTENPSDFLTLYPGKYTEREKPFVDKYFADNAALEARGTIDIKALISGTLPKNTPGLGPVIKVTEEWVKYNNLKIEPDNRLRTDAAYARSLGYQDILAFPTFGAHDDTFMVPYPPPARDKLLVSDLNHSVISYKPIYPGDTLYLVMNSREVLDLTPQTGSKYRSVAINSTGSIYNQKGEKVNDVVFRVTESVRLYSDASKAPKNPGFFDMWEAPDWKKRPEHKYTDKDWETIKQIWRNEKPRGATPLYWEDVKIGDRPNWTLDGPIEASISPTPPWGMGVGGSRTLKKEILDPNILKTMVRGEDGIYRPTKRSEIIPVTPADNASAAVDAQKGAINTSDIHKESKDRSPLINYMGREYAIRHIDNYMGEKGWLYQIKWGIMDPRSHRDLGKIAIYNPRAEHFLDKVPGMKGKYVNVHGLTKDVAIVKSYVTDKYVRNGDYLVDLVFWIETIDGDIFEEGMATVKLPSKN
jgi:hypothetical protein